MPLTVGNKTIGTLDALSRTNRFAFDSHHIQVLQMLASQAAIAIENARLYQEVRIVRDELEERVIERTAALKTAIGDLKAASLRRHLVRGWHARAGRRHGRDPDRHAGHRHIHAGE